MNPAQPKRQSLPTQVSAELARQLDGLRYGTIELSVHDGRIVQIERREKIRLQDDGKQIR
ncbi:MAG: YezD family protein [Porticoccaceae bacterium]|jgi:hypothetical protein